MQSHSQTWRLHRSRRGSLAMTVRELSLRAQRSSLTHKRGDCIDRGGRSLAVRELSLRAQRSSLPLKLGDCFGRSKRSLAMTVRKLSLRAPQCSLTHKRGDCIGRDGAPSQLGNCHCERSEAVSLSSLEIASGKERPRNDS